MGLRSGIGVSGMTAMDSAVSTRLTATHRWRQRGKIAFEGIDGGAELLLARSTEEPHDNAEHKGEPECTEKE